MIVVVELLMVIGTWQLAPDVALASPVAETNGVTNTEALGALIYTKYVYAFQAAGMILLIAMIGAIVLTHRTRPGVRKQKIADQVRRQPSETIEVRKVPPGQGI